MEGHWSSETRRQHEHSASRSSIAIRRNSKTSGSAAAVAPLAATATHAHTEASLAHLLALAAPPSPPPFQSSQSLFGSPPLLPPSSPSSPPTAEAVQHLDKAMQHSHCGIESATSCSTVAAMRCFPKRHRSTNTPLLWTILLAGCVALASSVHIVPPLLARGLQHLHLRRRETTTTNASPAAAAMTTARRLSVFGDDDRRPVGDPSQYPYSAVGLLRWTDTLSCTASLIGDRFIVTAAECVLDADGSVRKSSFAKPQFLPGYAAKSPAGAAPLAAASADKAYVTKVHKQSDYWRKWTQNTYVILELDAAVGQRYGVLQLPMLADLDQSTGKTEVQLAGYDDKALELSRAAMQYTKCTCYFPSGFSGPQYLLLHDCDTSAVGSPGSPLLVRYTSMKTYIIGIHSNAIGSMATPAAAAAVGASAKASEFKLETANRGVLGPFIQKHLEALVLASANTGTTPPTVPSTTATNSGSGSSHATSASSTTTTAPPRTANSRGRVDNSAVLPGASSTHASSTQAARITPAAAYICIAFVACAWASILFIAVRHVRRGTDSPSAAMDDDPIDETDALE